ncbi:MAG: aminotransferase class IV [Ardenticatenaceae bacterium]|nr:aminotransferase class IV [Anaerolineales bacterium]MCB8921528.1 aminotransferase class IV [Ardenticatenaceae bacterium]MCB8990934.1 aminotransferase class IV [Ardenticatenaceae bacterium]MCB9004415.1 aminotransferase class IV [Ardenticatenaceae bacterium]
MSTEFTWMHPQYIWLDDELAAAEDAPEALFAAKQQSGVFDDLRCYDTHRGPAVFRLQDYVERFLHTVQAMGIPDLGYDAHKLRAAICSTVQANGLVDCTIRPQVVYLNPPGQELDRYQATISIAVWRCGDEPQTPSPSGLAVRTSRSTDELILAAEEEGVLFTADHILLVQDGVIYAAPGGAMLGGLTRDTVLTLAQEAGYTVRGEPLTQAKLAAADEVLVCNTALEVRGVTEVDERPLPIGPITRQLQQLYAETVRGQNRFARRWLDYMDTVTVI